jgi:hypothetical protein
MGVLLDLHNELDAQMEEAEATMENSSRLAKAAHQARIWMMVRELQALDELDDEEGPQ